MQKERTHRQSIQKQFTEPVEYIPHKFMCQLIYCELENEKGITSDQYETALKKYPIFGKLYTLLKEFQELYSQRKVVNWIHG